MLLLSFALFLTIYAQFEWISDDNCDTTQVCDMAILVCPPGYSCSSIDEIDGIGFCCRDTHIPPFTPFTPHPSISQCKDLPIPGGMSECQAKSWLCTNPIYHEVMRVQCAKTCGFCTVMASLPSQIRPINDLFPFTRGDTRREEGCYDKTIRGLPSDCPARAHLCQSESHMGIMHKQCPKTCKIC